MQFLTLFVEELAAKYRLLQKCLQPGEGQKKLYEKKLNQCIFWWRIQKKNIFPKILNNFSQGFEMHATLIFLKLNPIN